MVKLLILGLFILRLIQGKIETSMYWNFVAETGSGLKNYLNVLKDTSFYRPAIILLIPLMGTFINRKIGWILIQSYFYFLILNIIFPLVSTGFADYQIILIPIIVFLLVLLFIILMNKRKISNEFYGIDKTELIGNNIIASSIGMSITILLAVLKASET